MQTHIRQRSLTCTPAAVGSAQTWSFAIKKGQRIMSCVMQRLVAAAGSTTSTFDARVDANGGGAAVGLLALTDTEGTVGSVVDGAGADLNSGRGYLVPSDGAVVVSYTPGATPGATIPSARFVFDVRQELPY